MIYVKIYLDKDENGEDMLVFDSAKENSKFFTVAGEKKRISFVSDDYYTEFERKTKVVGVEKVAISPEAKSLFLEMLNDKSVCSYNQFFQDFEFLGCYPNCGSFAFLPPNIDNGDTSRRLRRGESFTINYGDAQSALAYMTPCENERLKSLDITNPVDENELLDAYYSAMRAKGEELGCDEETIRKTPLRFLTEEQREVIRAEYRRLAAGYDEQEWHESRDYDHAAMIEDKIEEAIIKKYGKFIKG